jgi:acetoin utilization deacetylase AcuC-like enzyme
MMRHENHRGSHPEQPFRIKFINNHLEKSGLAKRCIPVECPLVDIKHLNRVHTKGLISIVENSKFKKGQLDLDDKQILKDEK